MGFAESADSVAKFDQHVNWQEARSFWAFQKPRRHPAPSVENQSWPRQPVDYFVLSRLEGSGLPPAAEASRRTLIRRLSMDLTGLPPRPEEVRQFVNDTSPNAFEQRVDRLIASPAFGEHFASLWLNVARYAEDQAHQVGKRTEHFYPNAWMYREWVIDAFNRDLPYNDFVRLQLAADLIEGGDSPNLPALGFLGLGHKYYSRGRLEVMADEWEDRVDTVTRGFLGLTVACARCHEHKYDPITMTDYYALAGVFASTEMYNKPFDEERYEKEKSKDKKPQYTMHIVQEDKVENLPIFLRGDVEHKGPEVQRGFVRILSEGGRRHFTEGSGRKELASAIATADNPLTARVFVNRIWGLIFGSPLVATPSNFGALGEKPTHPELLDDLAVRFTENGWSLKTLVRELVLSATYRQAADAPAEARRRDPENALLSHMNRRRLSLEQWRDSVLAVCGALDRKGGKSQVLTSPDNLRRTVYGRVSRLELNRLMQLLDYPDANVHAAGRAVTTTPTQKLYMMNNPFVIQRARELADRVAQAFPNPPEARIEHLYRLLFGRGPDEEERQLAKQFLAGPDHEELSRAAQFAQLLLISNEFLYID